MKDQDPCARIFRTLLLWTLVLGACSTGIPPADSIPQIPPGTTPSPTIVALAITENFSASPALPIPRFMRTLETPHTDQPPDGNVTTAAPPTFEGCAYMWAYEDMPELSGSLQQSIQVLHPGAQANAYAFGEDCIHADGSATFIAKETDFNITLQVNDLSNESDLGEWIVKVMHVIENIPQEQIVGPQPGLVSIVFQSNGDQGVVNFYINQYQALPPGLSNSEIYQALQIPQ